MNANDYFVIRSDWQFEEIRELYERPLVDLMHIAHTVHSRFHDPHEVQPCRIQSIKLGACPEDCKYCPQSGHYQAEFEKEKLYSVEKAVGIAEEAKNAGATRFCMGVAWRQIPENSQFDRVLEMVKKIDELGLEVCLTAGMMTKEQAVRLKEAGCTAYNHNLDTSPEFYGQIITTRTYQERLDTIQNVRDSGITVCCGGIIGLGETRVDRISLLKQLARFNPHPESVPINLLTKFPGMPLNDVPPPHPFEMVRMVATARILMPMAMVRLSAGRTNMTDELHALCYFSGANSIFMASEKMFVTDNPKLIRDQEILDLMGMRFSKKQHAKDMWFSRPQASC